MLHKNKIVQTTGKFHEHFQINELSSMLDHQIAYTWNWGIILPMMV